MTNSGKLTLIALVMFGAMFSPIHVNAQTIEEQRVALIEQLIVLLQEKVAILVAQLEAQQKEITTLKQPILGSVNMPEDTPFTLNVSTEFGKGSWDEYHERCKAGDCGNDFLDGQVRFTVDGEFAKATMNYRESGTPFVVGETMTFKNGGVHGYFKPNTKYTYVIEAWNEAGQKAHVEGEFTTGKY